MELIELDKIDSTNDFLKSYLKDNTLRDFFVVSALEQTRGRGQWGNTWESRPGENITCSIYRKVPLGHWSIPSLRMSTSLAVKRVLDAFVKEVQIKWPNDILIRNKKACGILIETIPDDTECFHAVIGIGVNVNQERFYHLTQATSLKLETGKHYDLRLMMRQIVSEMNREELAPLTANHPSLKFLYEQFLYKRDKVHVFSNPLDGKPFNGIIKGVTDAGKLVVLKEDDLLHEFDLKQIKF